MQLVGLLALALYASSRPAWTELLDGFALLRLGAAMAEGLLLVSATDAKELASLDEEAGWVGDCGSREQVRTLAIGGVERIK
jgi:hypothetical protein